MAEPLTENLHAILKQYQDSFSAKVYNGKDNDIDILMNIFGPTPELKREN